MGVPPVPAAETHGQIDDLIEEKYGKGQGDGTVAPLDQLNELHPLTSSLCFSFL